MQGLLNWAAQSAMDGSTRGAALPAELALPQHAPSRFAALPAVPHPSQLQSAGSMHSSQGALRPMQVMCALCHSAIILAMCCLAMACCRTRCSTCFRPKQGVTVDQHHTGEEQYCPLSRCGCETRTTLLAIITLVTQLHAYVHSRQEAPAAP